MESRSLIYAQIPYAELNLEVSGLVRVNVAR